MMLFVAASPVMVFLFQLILFKNYEGYIGGLISAMGLAGAIWVLCVAGSLPHSEFLRVMRYIALAHIVVCMYAIIKWDFVSAEERGARMHLLEIGTSVWAELALGAIVASVLSKRKELIIAASLIGGVVIAGAQMRGAGLSALSLLLFYWVLIGSKKFGALPTITISLLSAASMMIVYPLFARYISSILLLDDASRGISSGFSGRFDNWSVWIERFQSSPLIGVGLDRDVGQLEAHNGFIKLFAEYGIALGIPFCYFLVAAVRASWIAYRPEIVAAIVSYLVFILAAPRHISFQIMPFVALAAIAYSFLGLRQFCRMRVTTVRGGYGN